MNKIVFFWGLCFLVICGCNRSSSSLTSQGNSNRNVEQEETNFQPFLVYKDKGSRGNHFVPSGFMPNGKCINFNDAWQENCYDGKTCIRVEYDVACSKDDQKWAGIYWLNPANNWGSRKGGFNLAGARELSFWAKGEKGGERIEEFKMGGITGDFPDSDMAIIGPVILTNEWRKYTIDLRGRDLSYVSGGFSWSTNVDVNPDACTFYLDNIQYQ
ncbi:MAG TPA: hypothetical protein PLD92_04210 [Candidatus Omnitrophota bacterium]|jgi:hypothetical protein|nr:hypothetical protein [Candidatus Omnitrophota bacterium]